MKQKNDSNGFNKLKTTPYGYFNRNSVVSMRKGQNISGYPIGIMYIEDVWYPIVPGNVVNGYTFDFPVRLMPVQGLDIPTLFTAGEETYFKILETAKKLELEGCRAISGACGFFGNYQSRLADDIDIPVALSSLVQAPWILPLLKSSQKLLILTADASSITNKLLNACNIFDTSGIIIKNLGNEPDFSCILEGRGTFDNAKVQEEVIGKAIEGMNQDNIGAILLECSDMPPYAWAVQEACQVPVFDFTTLIRWLHNSVTQKPYYGFI